MRVRVGEWCRWACAIGDAFVTVMMINDDKDESEVEDASEE